MVQLLLPQPLKSVFLEIQSSGAFSTSTPSQPIRLRDPGSFGLRNPQPHTRPAAANSMPSPSTQITCHPSRNSTQPWCQCPQESQWAIPLSPILYSVAAFSPVDLSHSNSQTERSTPISLNSKSSLAASISIPLFLPAPLLPTSEREREASSLRPS